MSKHGIFKERTISVVNDLSLDEQLYLYKKTRELKKTFNEKGNLSAFKINNPDVGIYLVFLEDSTRTKESFRNAALFHNIKLNKFEATTSSFNKKESYVDTFRTLCGYSKYSIFIIRSRIEGVCRWLETAIGEYAERNGFLRPAFINAGDGIHEHPTQEFLDEFSFYEHKGWKTDKIHIALIGDLFHGRTAHSKADGLFIFKEVEVDLIAPKELSIPKYYKDKMSANGFRLRNFNSIAEYLEQNKIADIWYFTRLQLERMGEDVRDKSAKLRQAVTFKQEFIDKLPKNTKFYHPLPRHKEHPAIPHFLDNTSYNGWELQSINGYYTRIIEIAMLGGKLGADFKGKHPLCKDYANDFVEKVLPTINTKREFKIGIIPITNGIVIDHIGKGDDIETIWDHINNIRKLLDLNTIGSHGVFQAEKDKKFKGIVAIPGLIEFDSTKVKKLSAIAPGCTLNIIQNKKVAHKYRLHMPPRIYNFDEISCKNTNCISHPSHCENALTVFYRAGDNTFTCGYCESLHTFKQIWKVSV